MQPLLNGNRLLGEEVCNVSLQPGGTLHLFQAKIFMLPLTTKQPVHIEINKTPVLRHGPGICENEQDPDSNSDFPGQQFADELRHNFYGCCLVAMNATGNNKRELARCVGLKPDHTTIQKGHFCAVCQGAVPGLNGLISMGNGMPYEVLLWRKEKRSPLDDASS